MKNSQHNQCNHGSETNQQILNNEELILRAFLSLLLKGNHHAMPHPTAPKASEHQLHA